MTTLLYEFQYQNKYRAFKVYCPGCKCLHQIPVEGPAAWGWNQSLDKPTFTPSILITRGLTESRCHSFIKDGQWEFLADCTHELANKNVPLVDPCELNKPPEP